MNLCGIRVEVNELVKYESGGLCWFMGPFLI